MSASTLPPLPSYSLTPQPNLIPGLPDKYLAVLSPIIGYWVASLFFYTIDELDLFPQYRLHTPEEISKRNRVTKYEVFRDVITQHVVQAAFAVFLGYFEEDQMIGKENYDIAVWAQRVRIAQHSVPFLLGTLGVNASKLSSNLANTYPAISGLLAGGQYNALTTTAAGPVPGFASWEWIFAKGIYHLGIPALQFIAAVCILDTWQYFWHRAMHLNKWMYTTFHSRHHRLYVPYAFGALYNHPVEGFLLDTLGAGVAYLLTGMTPRQTMWFFTGSEIKTVDDHCGYAFPWDPLQHLTSNNAAYHDIHHQSWGIKTNFSQPYFTFWDRLLNTMWRGDATLRYDRDRQALKRRTDIAQEKASEMDGVKVKVENITEDIRQAPAVTLEIPAVMPTTEKEDGAKDLRRSPRKSAASAQSSGGLAAPIRELRNRIGGSLHGTGRTVLGVESRQ